MKKEKEKKKKLENSTLRLSEKCNLCCMKSSSWWEDSGFAETLEEESTLSMKRVFLAC